MRAFEAEHGDELTQERADALGAYAGTQSNTVRVRVARENGVSWDTTHVSVHVGNVPGEYGPLMPAWPVVVGGQHEVRCLGEWRGYLELLRDTYSQVSDKAGSLLDTMAGRSDRVAVGVMNDVLQVQMPSVLASQYSMIRHHAIMLLVATEWLPDERRPFWRDVYGELADAVFGAPSTSLDALEGTIAEVENEGLEGLRSFPSDSTDACRQKIERYLLMAGAAVGLVYRKLEREQWTWAEAMVPLARAYRSDRCLLEW